jgi:hypothetical protein
MGGLGVDADNEDDNKSSAKSASIVKGSSSGSYGHQVYDIEKTSRVDQKLNLPSNSESEFYEEVNVMEAYYD